VASSRQGHRGIQIVRTKCSPAARSPAALLRVTSKQRSPSWLKQTLRLGYPIQFHWSPPYTGLADTVMSSTEKVAALKLEIAELLEKGGYSGSLRTDNQEALLTLFPGSKKDRACAP
jgi:RNA:NAD 2'-phosphotransferase (TPT1/KptA family)